MRIFLRGIKHFEESKSHNYGDFLKYVNYRGIRFKYPSPRQFLDSKPGGGKALDHFCFVAGRLWKTAKTSFENRILTRGYLKGGVKPNTTVRQIKYN